MLFIVTEKVDVLIKLRMQETRHEISGVKLKKHVLRQGFLGCGYEEFHIFLIVSGDNE